MPLHLVEPGKRKGNPFYLVRGTVNGRDVEVSAKTTDEAAARRFALELELKLLDDSVPGQDEEVTFARAAEIYSAWRGPSDADQKRIKKLVSAIGKRPVGKIQHADLVDAANRLYPGLAAATRNREALRPAAAILHYASTNGWCNWLRIKLFKEPKPTTRAVSQGIARVLINSIPDLPEYERARSVEWLAAAQRRQRQKRLFLLWIFRQGMRISDVLSIKAEDVDLQARTFSYRIGKADKDVTDALDDEVFEALANDMPAAGYLFPWRKKWSVYNWLRPHCTKLGIAFTPHMARHSLGKWLNEDGRSLRQIMDTLRHDDPKSSLRYQSTDIEVIRETGRRLGKLMGKSEK